MEICDYYRSYCGYNYCLLKRKNLKYDPCPFTGYCEKCDFYKKFKENNKRMKEKNKTSFSKLFAVGNLICINKYHSLFWYEIKENDTFMEKYYNKNLMENENNFVDSIIKYDRTIGEVKILYNRFNKNVYLNLSMLHDWDFGKIVYVTNSYGVLIRESEDFFIINKQKNLIYIRNKETENLDDYIDKTNNFIDIDFNSLEKNKEVSVSYAYIEKIYKNVNSFSECREIEKKLEDYNDRNCKQEAKIVLDNYIEWLAK